MIVRSAQTTQTNSRKEHRLSKRALTLKTPGGGILSEIAIFQQSTNCVVIFSAVDNRPIESADRLVVHCERGYSRRSAVMGWMLKARRAGM